MTFSNVVMLGSGCAIPTENVTFTWTEVTGTLCNVETDKIVGTWNLINSTIRRAHVQSSSIDLINIDTLTANQWSGSPKRLVARDLTILCAACTSETSLQIGTSSYGMSDETSLTNITMPTSNPSVARTNPTTPVNGVGYPFSMSGGVITIPNAWSWNPAGDTSQQHGEIQTRGLVPGKYAVWQGGGGGGSFSQFGRVFKIVDVTQDIDNTYIQTSEAGGFPTGTWTTNGLNIVPHPAPLLTTDNLSGDRSATAFNGCPAQSPMYSCQTYVYTGSATGTTTVPMTQIWGELDTFTFTNNVPYTGAGALGWTISQFAQLPYLRTDNTQGLFGVSIPSSMINMKLPSSCGSCTRTLDQANPSGSNTQVGDSLTAPPVGAVFGSGSNTVFTANTPSDSPQVTVTLRTNQNLPP